MNTETAAATFPITVFPAAVLFIDRQPGKFAPNTTGTVGSVT